VVSLSLLENGIYTPTLNFGARLDGFLTSSIPTFFLPHVLFFLLLLLSYLILPLTQPLRNQSILTTTTGAMCRSTRRYPWAVPRLKPTSGSTTTLST
jgi:hypothetical protein